MDEAGIVLWMQGASPALDPVMVALTMLASHGGIWVVAGILLTVSKEHRRPGLAVLMALAAAYVAVELVIKPLVCRERPFETLGLEPIAASSSVYSFPSGHATYSFASATVLALFYGSRAAPALVLAVLISLSRIYLAMHWPTDVVAGAAIGVALGVLAVMVSRRILPDAGGVP